MIGLVRGHWDYKTKTQVLTFSSDELENVNMGMALVTPVDEILSVINREVLLEHRKAADRRRQNDKAPTLDVDLPVPERANALTRDDFEQAPKTAQLPDSEIAHTSDDTNSQRRDAVD